MANANFEGMTEVFMPNNPDVVAGLAFSTSTPIIDATGETILFGTVHLEGRTGSKTISSAGGSIQWRAGGTTVFGAGSTVRVGIQDVNLTTGPAPRGDATFDVYKDMVGGTDTITANAWNTATMANGSKTIAHGDLVAVVLSMTARGGTDVVTSTCLAASGAALMPAVTLETSGPTFTAQSGVPNVLIVFDDGTYGFLRGSFVFNTISSVTYNSGSTPDEYANIIRPPGPVSVDGLWCVAGPSANTGDFELILYSDPFGTPVAERTITIDANTVGATGGARLLHAALSSPYQMAAGTDYAVALRPTTANNDILQSYTVNANAHLKAHSMGPNCYGGTRTNQTGAFSAQNTTRYSLGIIAGGISDGAGSGGGLAMPVGGRICA